MCVVFDFLLGIFSIGCLGYRFEEHWSVKMADFFCINEGIAEWVSLIRRNRKLR